MSFDDEPSELGQHPDWYPNVEEEYPPRPAQEDIITADDYPMRVLAGAGTGKTFTMVRKIEHLIDEEVVDPDRILALTFTNKAADSMRRKLTEALGADGYDVDAYTYHSICNELLTEYAYHAGVDPGYELAGDADSYALVLEILDDLPYRYVKPDVFDPDGYGTGIVQQVQGFVSAMKRSGVEPGQLRTYLGDVDRLEELTELPGHIEETANDLLRGVKVSSAEDVPAMLDALEALQAELQEARRDLNVEASGLEHTIDGYLESLIRTCDSLAEAFDQLADSVGTGDLEDVHKLPEYLFGGYSNAPKGIPDVGFTFPDKLRSYLEACQAAQDLTEGYAQYQAQLDERDLLDFDDLVIRTTDLLADDEVGPTIAEQWDYVFCDEFQDTDPLQFELVRGLVTDGRLFVVGDDDQAIYEWRGANPDNITAELDETYGDDIVDEHLEENFRSHQPILDLANEALELAEDRASDKELERYDPPEYDGDAVATISTDPVDVPGVDDPDPDENDDGELDDETKADQLAKTITQLLAGDRPEVQRAYDPGDIAVLVRKNRHATPIIEALRETGIPYQVAGDLTPESVGVETVLAYLKALADPGDEVSLNRVLTMRYRVHDHDLRRLNQADDDLYVALATVPREDLVQPGRVERAREDFEALLDLRDSSSIGRLYRELTDRTDIEWYLTEQEQRDLDRLEEVITAFGEGTVQPELSQTFVDLLSYHGSLTRESSGTPVDQPETASDAVNVMTIHKSKGLDFPVVILPELEAGEWSPQERDYASLDHAITDAPKEALQQDFQARDAEESRRVLHVGMTRAEEHLILQGRGTDSSSGAEEGEVPLEFVADCLDPSIHWTPGGVDLPIWRDIQACLPADAGDWTGTVAAEWASVGGGEIVDGEERLSPAEARERVLALADAMLEGTIAHDGTGAPIDGTTLVEPAEPMLSQRHSYTSLETFDECPRKYYLDHLVRAFDDYEDTGRAEGPSQREIGILFHDTAELASHEGARTIEEWVAICERLAVQKGFAGALPEARQCIERFFRTEVSEWTCVGAEREFTIDLDGHTVTGLIDAIYERPDGDLVVLDYKATRKRRDLEENLQMPLYLIACERILDREVAAAGYVYVGDVGPAVDIREFDDAELEDRRSGLITQLETIEAVNFDEYTPGKHCEWCPHRSLPCSDEADIE